MSEVYKPGDSARHKQLGVVTIKRVLAQGVTFTHPDFEGEPSCPFSAIEPIPREEVARQTLEDFAGSIAAMVQSGEITGIATVVMRAEGGTAHCFAGDMSARRKVVGELEFLKQSLMGAANA